MQLTYSFAILDALVAAELEVVAARAQDLIVLKEAVSNKITKADALSPTVADNHVFYHDPVHGRQVLPSFLVFLAAVLAATCSQHTVYKTTSKDTYVVRLQAHRGRPDRV